MTERPDRRVARITLAVVLAAGAPAGCADATDTERPAGRETSVTGPDQERAPGPSASTTPSPPAGPATTEPASPPASSDGPTITVTGTVGAGVEAGCLVLTAGGTTYELLGARDVLRAGDRVTVEGALAEDVVTTCQQGTPLRVRVVRPG